ncbi:MAG: hypothetical protein CMF98_02495 [Candidatus Marinimicrobia bacterium]|nr:hypothetical protein [Candidatus Neomarinimicrobiota bacterium]OUW50859.1 MAG: hypothetical protein CBD50_01090 [bacterium TMED190]|tara:strand:+ start:4215 stop:5162 length:948 start_codon:yes stop_codon:yes gene_type:complete
MKFNFNLFFFLFFISSFNTYSQESNKKDAFFLDLGVVIEPSTGKEKVDHLVKAPPSKVSFFLDKKSSGSVFMASTKEIASMLEDIQQKIDNIPTNFSKDLMVEERNNYKKISARLNRVEKSLDKKLNELEIQNNELKKIISEYLGSKNKFNTLNDNDYQKYYISDNVISNLEDYKISLIQIPGKHSIENDSKKIFKNLYVNGVIAYQKGDYHLAIENFNQLNIDNYSVITKGNVLYWLAESFYNLKKYEDALKILNKLVILKESDKQDDGIILKGIIFKNLGKFSYAREAYTEIVDFFPKSEYLRLAKIELSKKY